MTTLKETTIARRDRKLISVINCGQGLTEQAHKKECDINVILRDYSRTGFIKHAKEFAGKYDDVTGADFQAAMITVANVKSMFEALPSAIKKEFDYAPDKFLDYVQDPKNGKELAQRNILVGNDGINVVGLHSNAMTKTAYNEFLDRQAAIQAAAEQAGADTASASVSAADTTSE